MMSILGKTNNFIIIMSRNILLILSIYFFQITLYAQESTTISDQSENLVEEIKGPLYFNSRLTLLNNLAYCYSITGDKKKALEIY